jgi:hypothetical protein
MSKQPFVERIMIFGTAADRIPLDTNLRFVDIFSN